MTDDQRFYQKKSNKFSRYKFSSKAKLVKGEKPNFLELIIKYSNKEFVVLDLGCGSGELAIELSPYFKEVVGIDPIERYIETANEDKKKKKIKNVKFIVAKGENLPFKDNMFDMVISSRGPLSSNSVFFRESKRVLKGRGLFIEETIGENDKIELKEIFNRGQNYPPARTKLNSVNDILVKEGFKLIHSKHYTYYQNYNSMDSVIKTLERAPIIPDFDIKKDKESLKAVKEKLLTKNGILLSTHRLHWIARGK